VPKSEAFDYLWPNETPPPPVGARVRVPFGRGERIGFVVGYAEHSRLDAEKLKPISAQIDSSCLFDTALLDLLKWSASYYHEGLGSVLMTALPSLLRDGRSRESRRPLGWACARPVEQQELDQLRRRAPRQVQALDTILGFGIASREQLVAEGVSLSAVKALETKRLLERRPLQKAAARDQQPSAERLLLRMSSHGPQASRRFYSMALPVAARRKCTCG
jgi:primosomal protein N' (replication factor Y)